MDFFGLDEIPKCHSGCQCHRCSLVDAPPKCHSGYQCHRPSLVDATPKYHSGCQCHRSLWSVQCPCARVHKPRRRCCDFLVSCFLTAALYFLFYVLFCIPLVIECDFDSALKVEDWYNGPFLVSDSYLVVSIEVVAWMNILVKTLKLK